VPLCWASKLGCREPAHPSWLAGTTPRIIGDLSGAFSMVESKPLVFCNGRTDELSTEIPGWFGAV
jgi:hypothetical protein